jgi:hypothetical protein
LIIKHADDKTKRVNLLTELTRSDRLDAKQRQWASDELMRLQRGIQGERDAAFYIDSYFKDSNNRAVLHDLRIEVDGDVAQIDHLVINRMNFVFLFETKCFNGNLSINEHGEFTMNYAGGKQFGIPSPLEQSRRHERVLAKLLDTLGITGRTAKPTFVHAVLLHPKAIITRPAAKAFNTDNVIKADAIETWHQKWIDKDVGVTATLNAFLNVRSQDTVREWGEKLARQHRPSDLLALPDFMRPREAVPPRAQVTQHTSAPAAKPTPAPTQPAVTANQADDSLKRKLICVTCRNKITFPEGKFCWANERRFGGFQYCREHQAQFQ